MNTNLPSSSTSQQSSQPDRPRISAKENQQLPRHERIYNHLLWPKYFDISDTDSRALDRMRLAYNILMAAPTDLEARAMIKAAIIGVRLSLSEVIELIWETKALFGRIGTRNSQFDRDVMRAQLIDVARRAKLAGDIKQERLVWNDIIRLDDLALKEKESAGPIVPPLPDVVITNVIPPAKKENEYDDAIVESTPADEEE
jgi:hypothetical protein